MILNHKIHVLTKKEELDTVRLAGKVAVVLDVLFATSTMVTGAGSSNAFQLLPASELMSSPSSVAA